MAKKRWVGLFFIALGVSMIIVDATIVNVAVPTIIEDLKITSTQAQWIQETYTLVFASLLLVFGRLADRFGRRQMFSLGVLVFIVSSVVAATSGSGNLLIAARLVQGIGGAMMLPTSLSLLNSTFFGKERGIAFAVWGSTIGGTAALGPLLGGWLTTDFTWRWAFGINIPLGLLVLVGVSLCVKESRGEAESGADYVGALLSVLGIGAIVFGLIEGRTYGWWGSLGDRSLLGVNWTWGISPIPLFFVLGIAVIFIFAKVQLKLNALGKPVLLDLSLFKINSFRNANIASAIVSLGEFGLLFSLPLWLQNVRGYSAFGTGVVLLALAIGSFFASGAGGPVGAKRGPVAVVRLGILLELIGVAAIALVISPTTSTWLIVIPLFIYGMGVGLATAQLTGVVLAEVPLEKSGQGSGIASTTRQIGSALGIAILGTVLFSSLGTSLNSRLENQTQIPAATRTALTDGVVRSAGGSIAGLQANPATADVAIEAKAAFSTASRNAAFVASGFLLIGWLATRSLGRRIRKDEGIVS